MNFMIQANMNFMIQENMYCMIGCELYGWCKLTVQLSVNMNYLIDFKYELCDLL